MPYCKEMMPEASDKGLPTKWCQMYQIGVVSTDDANNIGMPYCKEMMPEASDNGSQPYSCPLGDCEPTVTVREARESKWLV